MARGGGGGGGVGVVESAVIAYNLGEASSWWHNINASSIWQYRIFHALAILYGLVAVVALVQLIRIQLRVPEYGWTTQKVFHFLNFVVNGVRSAVFVFRRQVQNLHPEIVKHILLDMPSLAFFTTYALLVLFWAEIYYQARAVSTDGLRPSFLTINAVVYVIQVKFLLHRVTLSPDKRELMELDSSAWKQVMIAMWLILWWKPIPVLFILSKMFFAGVSLFAALGFLLYGGRLFLMLQRFPVESKGRRKKLQEVGYVTTICFTCFLVRCVMMCFNAFDKAANLDVLNHPVLNFIYYLEVASKAWDHTISSHSLRGFRNIPMTETEEQTYKYATLKRLSTQWGDEILERGGKGDDYGL
ncbi:hypothetical protein C1H46_014528 [Malus baccata]|uniref:THH1/TOM1/TOM3 domain-containing protein n=1 Tax=Malus baccata TaxID=106549 RepID=A0A540MLY0_MALBA|nr:hypothetical protein C1H46_014528 [Malus baccata]